MSWIQDAACRDIGTEPFYTTDPTAVDAAKAICRACPVRQDCLTDAMQTEDYLRWGVWGGLTPDERRDLASVR